MSCFPTSQPDQAAGSVVSSPIISSGDRGESQSQTTGPDRPAGLFRGLVVRRLSRMLAEGVVQLKEGSESLYLGASRHDLEPALLTVRNPRFYRRVALAGSLGAAESYIQGDWDSPHLCQLLQVLGRNAESIGKIEGLAANLFNPIRYGMNWLRRNTKSGSRQNIAAHYDLSNEFFALMLDSSMTYSSAVFKQPSMNLNEAQREKYDRICRKLQLKAHDRVLEIGTGWGGFAIHAAKYYGCHVTTTTISEEQFRLARERFRQAGVSDRVTLLKHDYRELQGQFDKLVSIEMIEAVGEKFLSSYFSQCSQLLKPSGAMCLQTITIPDHRYDAYRKSVDFIQKYIFPGGFLPSFLAISQALASHTDFRMVHSEDFGPHYATTLDRWRTNFWNAIDQIQELGFDQKFIRTWEYYLCYCQAGFAERLIGVTQMVFTKPHCRMNPVIL